MVDEKLRAFIESPVMQVLGSVGSDHRCSIGRGSGARFDAASGLLEIAISAWQWPQTIVDLRVRPAISATFMSPLDYTCFQLKGRALLRAAAKRDVELARRYIAATYEMMTSIGMPPNSSRAFFSDRELWVASMRVEEVFVQTPGLQAGRLWAPA